MGKTRDITNLEREILVGGLDDYVGLWELFFLVRGHGTVRDVAGEVHGLLAGLLGSGLLRSGKAVADGSFVPDGESAEATLGRVRRLGEELGRDPDVGEGPWFDLTPEGEMLARDLSA